MLMAAPMTRTITFSDGGPPDSKLGASLSLLTAFAEGPNVVGGQEVYRDDGKGLTAFVTYGGDAAHLRSTGARVRAIAPDPDNKAHVATVDLSDADLRALRTDKHVRWVELSPPVERLHPTTVLERGDVPAIRSWRAALSALAGLDGTGVLLGIIDENGIDADHPVFRGRRASASIEAAWDQRRCSRPPASPLDHLPMTLSEPHHGTAVASIAFGAPFLGSQEAIAPGADFVFVSVPSPGIHALGSVADLADAAAFVFERAGERPCVVNVSLGSSLGPHDGTSAVERFFGNLLKVKGRVITAAAGNFRATPQHLRGALSGGPAALEFIVREEDRYAIALEIWTPPGERIEVRIRTPSGEITEAVPAGAGTRRHIGDGADLRIASICDAPGNGHNVVHVQIHPKRVGEAAPPGKWAILVTPKEGATGNWDAWMGHPHIHWQRGPNQLSNELTVCAPASHPSVIAVGDHLPKEGVMAGASGRGLLRCGAVEKPDIQVQGSHLRAALADTKTTHPVFGSSFAAPVAAGLAARLFQRDGKDADIRAALLALTR